MLKTSITLLFLITLNLLAFGCAQQESSMSLQNAKDTALKFSNLMSSRNYSDAYEMTSKKFKNDFSLTELQENFEDMIPSDWGEVSPIEVGESMTEWPAKEPSDIAWVYVILGGDVYSEALILILTDEDDSIKIRNIEFGRP